MTPPKLVLTNRSYEELEGGQGREVFFRPHRYRAQDLAPLQGTVQLQAAGATRSCPIQDISQNGAAIEWPAGVAVGVGDNLGRVQLLFDDVAPYAVEARVGSVREQDGARVVGLSFSDALLDIDDVLHLRDIRAWQGREPVGLQLSRKPWAVPGNADFKVLVSELALFLHDSEAQLSDLESQLAWHIVNGPPESRSRQVLVARLRSEFVSDVVRLSDAIDATYRAAPAAHVRPLRVYSHRHLHAFMMKAPWMHRALHKPFGYPGDYEVMRFVYERDFEGPTLFAKAVSYAFLQTKAALAVKYRKDLMKRQLRAMIEARGACERPLRVLSVAAGPAQELCELVAEIPELPAPLEVVLFDQDKGALSYAYRRLRPLVDARFGGGVRILYLHESIKRLLRDAELFTGFGKFDAIYSCGLFDYLQTTTAVVLARNLFARLREGGALCVGNMAPENPSRWFMEMHLDWHLLHRTRPELVEIGERAAPGADIRILEEESGVNPFIEMTKG
jgi:extracellular factor (EF) 3-hydroxypalmitic acid methyl ester biosynthesis protein